MSPKSIVKPLTVVAALTALGVAAPVALANEDIASPDPVTTGPAKQVIITGNDLRSPDATAAAADPTAASYPTATVVKVGNGDSGFDWGDAGIGAGGTVLVLALAAGGVLLVTRRKTTPSDVSPAAS
ncbi:MAG TPA: hypothetical protein VHR88_01785 [Solirubrobacteraceae bacterium]|jgi:hypothetical protein|nr:hypothetical protein [Solirubrobacteraceae bacterium]